MVYDELKTDKRLIKVTPGIRQVRENIKKKAEG